MAFPNDDQKKVIEHTGKPLIVVAAPGTGKTKTIITRMERLLKEDPNREVSFITFTRTSRRDTERKINEDVGKDALYDANFDFPRISTLHTYAKSIVHKYSSILNRDSNFSMLIEDRGERILVITEVIKDLALNMDIGSVGKALTYFRNTSKWSDELSLSEIEKQQLLDCFESLLKFYNTFDMEGIVPAACAILTSNPTILPSVYLQVDEYQDLNPIDQRLVELAASSGSSQIVVVGDDAQSIYGFRDANPKGINDLWNSEKWEHINFNECHRLPTHILRAAQALISKKNYLGGQVNIPDDDGKKIGTLQCTKSDLQIDTISHLINLIKSSKTCLDGTPLNYKNFMILCPTSAFVGKVADCLEKTFSIPAKQREKNIIPDDHWRLLLVIRMLYHKDSLALRQWLAIIKIGPHDINFYRTEAIKLNVTLFDYCSKLDVQAIREIYSHLDKLNKSVYDIDLFKKELLDFPNLLIEDTLFPEVGITLNALTKQPTSIGSVIRIIHEKFGLLESEIQVSDEDKVLVTTMYSAKGLEAEFVFIMWCNSTFMPAPGTHIEEQLRVLYVALTRAKQDVILTFHEKFASGRLLKREAMSPFLKHIENHLQIVRITKPNLKSLTIT